MDNECRALINIALNRSKIMDVLVIDLGRSVTVTEIDILTKYNHE